MKVVELTIGCANSPPFPINITMEPSINNILSAATAVPPTEVIFLIFSIPLVDTKVTNIIQRTASMARV